MLDVAVAATVAARNVTFGHKCSKEVLALGEECEARHSVDRNPIVSVGANCNEHQWYLRVFQVAEILTVKIRIREALMSRLSTTVCAVLSATLMAAFHDAGAGDNVPLPEIKSISEVARAEERTDPGQVAALNVRFVDNGDGTISDYETGLMWEKRARDGSLHDVGTVWQTWSSSGTAPDGSIWTRFISGLNAGDGFAGHKDWRIPTLTELQGILDNSLPPPKMPPVFNNGCVDGCTVTTCSCPHGGFVWSATPDANNPYYAWVVFFNEGRSLTEGKWNGAAVRAVRTMDVSVDSGLVAHYPFSGDATDASGRGNDGTPTTASLTTDRFGLPGQAYNFKADVGSYVRVPNSSSLGLPGNFSVSLWVKFNQGWGYHTEALIWKLSGTPPSGTTGWHLGLNEDSGYTAGFLLMNPGVHLAAGKAIDFERDWLGKWNHVVGVRSAGQLHLFVNGALLASAADGGLSVSSAGDLIIGGSSHPVSGAYDRDIDDVRIYDRALTPSEVAQLFALESAPPVCGNGIVESGEDCDGGNSASGDCCSSTCHYESAGSVCSDEGNVCTDDECDGLGSCAHQPIALAPLCEWVAIGGSDTVRSSIRTRYSAQISGSICADRGDIGESTGILVAPGTANSSLAFLEDNGTAVKVRPKATVANGRVVTGGGCVTGLELAEIFGTTPEPLCCENSPRALPGGVDGNVIDACGLDPLLDACSASKAQVTEDVAMLDGLSATQRLGTVAIGPGGSYTILLDDGLNVIDMDRLRMDQSSALTLDAQGNPGVVAILRLANGMSTKVKATIKMQGGAAPENTLIYAASGNCIVGWNNSGNGSLFCPNGKIRMGVDTEWFGSVAAGGIDIGWGTTLTHVPFVGLSHDVLGSH